MESEAKRQDKRISIDSHFLVECRSKNIWQYVEARDISERGVFLVTDKVESPRTKVEMMFELSKYDQRSIFAQGVVAWSRPESVCDEKGAVEPAGMGIMFTKLTPAAVTKSFIAQLEKEAIEKGPPSS